MGVCDSSRSPQLLRVLLATPLSFPNTHANTPCPHDHLTPAHHALPTPASQPVAPAHHSRATMPIIYGSLFLPRPARFFIVHPGRQAHRTPDYYLGTPTLASKLSRSLCKSRPAATRRKAVSSAKVEQCDRRDPEKYITKAYETARCNCDA